jgi:subtilase family serine protease
MNLLRKPFFSRALFLLAALPLAAGLLMAPLAAQAQTATPTTPLPRIASPISGATRFTLAGSHPPRVDSAPDRGAVDPSLALSGMAIVFSRSSQQEAALQALLAAQQDPASPQYHQWLTPDQFGTQFGVADSDLAATESWLQQQGFTVSGVSRGRNRIFFSGTAAQAASAFGASIHNFSAPDGTTHFAPTGDLTLPAALSGSVLSVEGLSSFHPTPQLKLTPRSAPSAATANPAFTSATSGGHFLAPGDIAVMYDVKPAYSAGYTGLNQSIAVVGQSYIYPSDIAAFQSAAGISAKTPVLVLVPSSGSPAVNSTGQGNEGESDLDLEWSSAMAPGAQVYFVYTGNNSNYSVFNSIVYAVDENIAPIVSSSYGQCEATLSSSDYQTLEAAFKQGNAQGQTFLSAAGDSGSAGCFGEYATGSASNYQLSVNYPSSSAYVTALGGTEIPVADTAVCTNTYFTAPSGSTCSNGKYTAGSGSNDILTSLVAYAPEQVWNDDVAEGTPAAGGGGVSVYEARPSWQSGTIGGVAIPSGSYRLQPDISLTASNYSAPLLFCTSDESFWVTAANGYSAPYQQNSCNNGFRDSATGDLTLAGGTSFDAPMFAGMLALISQSRNSTGQGNINPTLYTLAANSTTYASAFHDITSGGNQCLAGTTDCGTSTSAVVTNYAATTGYDEASGLGSIDLFNLLTAWPKTTSSSLAGTTTNLTAAAANPATSATGSYNLTNGVAMYNFSSATTGSHVLVATYSGDATHAASTGTLTITVGTVATNGGSITLSASPSTLTVAPGAQGSIVVTATPGSGYVGTVVLGLYYPSNLTNFCVTDPTGTGDINITGTTAATDTITFYTNVNTCNNLGLTVLGRGGAGNQKVSLGRVHIVASAQPPPSGQPSPLRKGALPAALACLVLTFGLGRSSRLRRSSLLRGGLAVACIALLSLAGFGLTACSSSASPSQAAINSSYTAAGTYSFTITGADSINPTITATTPFTLTVN